MRQIATDRDDVRQLFEAVEEEFRTLAARLHRFEAGECTPICRSTSAAPLLGDFLLVDPPAAGCTVFLPPADAASLSENVGVKNLSASVAATLKPSGSDTIDASTTSLTVAAGACAVLKVAAAGRWARVI